MLNLDDPHSEFIFEASGIEDLIRAELLLMRDAKGSAELIGREETIRLVLIPQLHQLNKQHFDDSPKIRQTIQAFEHAVSGSDHARVWNCFLALAEHPGDNFGTWMI